MKLSVIFNPSLNLSALATIKSIFFSFNHSTRIVNNHFFMSFYCLFVYDGGDFQFRTTNSADYYCFKCHSRKRIFMFVLMIITQTDETVPPSYGNIVFRILR